VSWSHLCIDIVDIAVTQYSVFNVCIMNIYLLILENEHFTLKMHKIFILTFAATLFDPTMWPFSCPHILAIEKKKWHTVSLTIPYILDTTDLCI